MVSNSKVFLGMSALLALSGLLLSRCDNSPYRSGEAASSTIFTYYTTPPSKLDPATSYYSHEGEVLDNIYEPPFDYHYLKRPYSLIPLTAESVPEAVLLDKDGRALPADASDEQVARVEYVVKIKQGIQYQPHPCFVKNSDGSLKYGRLSEKDLVGIRTPNDFPEKSTRELTAEDYAIGIRRLADPRVPCPVFATLSGSICGLSDLSDRFRKRIEAERARRKEMAGASYNSVEDEKRNPIALDYFSESLEGVQVLDRYTFKIMLNKRYPQILYWMAMHFFAPIPVEALVFYAQPGLAERQISLNTWPVGTGAYYLKEYEPNRLITLVKNPNFHDDFYPTEGESGDAASGLLEDSGKRLPQTDHVRMILEKEPIPQWNKFLQGFYDSSSITPEAFDRAVNLAGMGQAGVSDELSALGIRMNKAVIPGFYYIGFNMRDPVVGGYSESHKKLRQAISIAFDYNEYLDIFLNGQGLNAQGPIPPGIFGAHDDAAGVNPITDVWDPIRKRPSRRPIEEAKALMSEAGFPDGRSPDGHPLVIYLDHAAGGEPSFASRFDWMRNRLKMIGVDLQDRGTELKRFREKTDKGAYMVCMLGWYADYPDPENFLFLFYGPNARVPHMGENVVNYQNDAFDRIYTRMVGMSNSPERMKLIDQLMALLREDAPTCWGMHPVSYGMTHEWYKNSKPHLMSKNTLKYRRVDTELRVQRQGEWNRPRTIPVLAVEALALFSLWPAILSSRRKEQEAAIC